MSPSEIIKIKLKMQHLEDTLNNVEKKVDAGFLDFNKKMDTRFEDLKEIIARHSDRQIEDTTKIYNEMKYNYSKKWVEKLIIWAGMVTGTILLSGAIYVILSHNLIK